MMGLAVRNQRFAGRSFIAGLAFLLLTWGCSGDDPLPPCDCQEVTFSATDGVSLHGRLFGGEEQLGVAVVLAHMHPADQRSWQPFAETLTEVGYTAFTFDFRGYGSSEGEKEIGKLDQDVAGAVQYLRDRGVRGVFLIGASMGGTASLRVAAQEPFLGVVTLSAPSEFQGLNALEVMGQVETAVFFIVSEGDESAHRDSAAMYQAAPGNRAIEIYQGSDHGTDLLTGQFGEQVQERLLVIVAGYAS